MLPREVAAAPPFEKLPNTGDAKKTSVVVIKENPYERWKQTSDVDEAG
jgi:hypothetical protein